VLVFKQPTLSIIRRRDTKNATDHFFDLVKIKIKGGPIYAPKKKKAGESPFASRHDRKGGDVPHWVTQDTTRCQSKRGAGKFDEHCFCLGPEDEHNKKKKRPDAERGLGAEISASSGP